MKRIIYNPGLLFFMTILVFPAMAQEVSWYQPGHEWFYKSWCSGMGSPGPCGYNHFTVLGSAEVGGFEASVVVNTRYDSSGVMTEAIAHYFRVSGDSVFHYYEPSEIWYLLYSFNTPVGESWAVQGDTYVGYGFEEDLENWRFEVVVDSIVNVEIVGIVRRKVYTSPSFGAVGSGFSTFYFSDGVIEGIGAVGMWMFGDAISFIGLPGAFSCFIENEEIVYGPFGYPCLPVSTEGTNMGTLEIFPNPATDQFTITLPIADFSRAELRLYDISGRLVFSELNFKADQIVLTTDFSPGLYILNLHTAEGTFSGKLVIE